MAIAGRDRYTERRLMPVDMQKNLEVEYAYTEAIDFGRPTEVAPDIFWVRMPLELTGLNHINLWLLRDGSGWSIIDTGMRSDKIRDLWESVFADFLEGRPVTRVICTHFHPDHISLAGCLIEKWNAPLWMTYSEWMQAQLNRFGGPTADIDARMDFYIANGMERSGIDGYRNSRPDFSKIIFPLPVGFRRIIEMRANALVFPEMMT